MQTQTTNRFDVRDINRMLSELGSRYGRKPSTGERTFGVSPTVSKAEIRAELAGRVRMNASRRKRRVLRAYDRAAAELTKQRLATETFIRTIIEQSCDLHLLPLQRDFDRLKVIQFMCEQLSDLYHFQFSSPNSVKSLELLAKPAEVIHRQLSRHLEQSLDQFVDELFEIFDRMRRRHVLGGIRYDRPFGQYCEFTYFRSKAVPDPASAAERTDLELLSVSNGRLRMRDGDWWRQRNVTVRSAETKQAILRHVRVKHLLSDVQTIPVDSWWHALPKRVIPVAKAIPDFLRPWASVVQGKLEHALFVEADVGTVPYTYPVVVHREEEVQHNDPCLLLGPNVIAGWCPDEQPPTRFPDGLAAILCHRLSARKRGAR